MSEFQYSERQACKLISLDRTTYRYQPRPDHNAELRSNRFLDPWLDVRAKPKLRPKSYQDYEGLPTRTPPQLSCVDAVFTPSYQRTLEQLIHGVGLGPETFRNTLARPQYSVDSKCTVCAARVAFKVEGR